MKLSKRIFALADKVNRSESVADIGTDHGYVPMLLMRSGKCPKAIMSDISEGSLSKARETFELTGLTCEADWFRTGDGLETIEKGEADVVIIAGLGGHTIAGILASDIEKSRSFKRLILQPRKHSGTLRYFLYTNGWDIESEGLAEEGKFACEIITAVPTGIMSRNAPYPEDDIRWKYPEEIITADPLLARKRIDWKISSIVEQMENLKKSSGNDSLIERLKADLEYLTGLLE